jgi:hypothetical protein
MAVNRRGQPLNLDQFAMASERSTFMIAEPFAVPTDATVTLNISTARHILMLTFVFMIELGFSIWILSRGLRERLFAIFPPPLFACPGGGDAILGSPSVLGVIKSGAWTVRWARQAAPDLAFPASLRDPFHRKSVTAEVERRKSQLRKFLWESGLAGT